MRVALIAPPMLDHQLAPAERIAGIVPSAIEELAEVHVEIAQEGPDSVDVRERDAQISAVLLRPTFEGKNLTVAKTRAQRLTRLQEFMRHRAHRDQAECLGKKHVRRAGEDGSEPRPHDVDHAALPGA